MTTPQDRFQELSVISCGVKDASQEDRFVDVLDEVALVASSKRGDLQAFDRLVTLHERSAFALAFRILGNREDAEDATQEAFVRAWKSLGRFEEKRGFKPWLMKIVANRAISLKSTRRPGPAIETEIDCLPDPKALPDRLATHRETLQKLDELTRQLPPASAALFQLRYAEQMSVEEVAHTVGLRPGTVAVMLHRMREKFRAVLFGTEEDKR